MELRLRMKNMQSWENVETSAFFHGWRGYSFYRIINLSDIWNVNAAYKGRCIVGYQYLTPLMENATRAIL